MSENGTILENSSQGLSAPNMSDVMHLDCCMKDTLLTGQLADYQRNLLHEKVIMESHVFLALFPEPFGIYQPKPHEDNSESDTIAQDP